tara:strand:- start:246 stop:530 length:285 start_codon:yes stop_codon:yes gene_type:complete
MSFLLLPALVVVMYLLLIRPQQKKAKDHRDLMDALDVGHDVVTSAGIYGRVSEIDGDTLFLQVSDDVALKITRESVAGVVSYDDDDSDDLTDSE